MDKPVKVAAVGGKVTFELPEPAAYGVGWRGERTWASVTLTIEQADELANVVAEAQLVAMEQRVRAGKRGAPVDDSCYCLGGVGAHPYHGTPR